jgi:hypothetical protein
MNIKEFVFESGLKRNLMIGMVIGLVSLAVQFFTGDQYHTEFWSTWLQNSVFFTGISFTAAFFLAGLITGYGGWMTVIRRIWEAMSMFMIVGIALLSVIVIGVWGHLHNLYLWNIPGIADPAQPHFDKIIAGKAGFLNAKWLTVAAIGFVAFWYWLATKLRAVSLAQDEHETPDLKLYKKSRNWSAYYLPAAGFLSPMFFWLLTMSVEPHWYSTMFAWYSMISTFLASLALTMLIMIYLKSKGYMDYITKDHLHDVGKFMFGITVFWMYLWFDQFMLIWYANNGEETIYFKERMEHYPVLFYGNLVINFLAPFLILMRNDNKRKMGTLTVAALLIFFGHWWDYFTMIKPGARAAAYEAQHILGHGDAHHGAATLEHGTAAVAGHAADVVTDAAHATTDHAIEAVKGATDHVVAHTPDAVKDAAHAAADHVTEAGHAAAEGVKDAAHGAADHVADHTKDAVKSAAHTVAQGAAAVTAGVTDAIVVGVADVAHATDAHTEAGDDAHGGGHEVAAKPHGGHPGPKHFQFGYTLPGFLDLGALIGFLSLFLFVVFYQLTKASLVPRNDPFLDESLHYSTGAHIDEEIEEAGGGAGHH